MPLAFVHDVRAPRVMFGAGALERIPEELDRLGAARVLLICTPRRGDAVELFLRLTGLGEAVIEGARRSPMWAAMESMAPSLAYDDAVMGDGSVPREMLAGIGVPVLSNDGFGVLLAQGAEAARVAAAEPPTERT